MSEARKPNSRHRVGLALLLAAAGAGCNPSPTAPSAQAQGLVAVDAPSAHLAHPTPAMEREIHRLLQAWEAAWAANDGHAYGANYAEDADFVNPLGGILSGRQAIAAQHVFLFNGPFAGSVQTGEVRRLVALSGTLAVLDMDVTLTGYQALPPGLAESAPGVVLTRAKLVVGKNGSRWEILDQQLTRFAPAP